LRDFSAIRIKTSRIADRQYGHVTRQQLLELGVPSQTVVRWIANGRLTPVHAGVYAVGHAQHSAPAKAMAAVLACGDRAVLSHDSAAALWGIRRWPQVPEVTCALERRRPNIRTHRTETLSTRDVRRHHNIRVTSPSRTILDIQTRLTDPQLTRAINELRLHEHLKATELARLLSRSTRIANLVDPTQNPTRSGKEDDFVRFCRDHGLPIPRTNVMLFGHERDAVFEPEKVIVEIDTWATHKSHQSFRSDRKRDALAAEHGYLTIRVIAEVLAGHPRGEADSLRKTLANRRRGASS
jgi:hypothetical protein